MESQSGMSRFLETLDDTFTRWKKQFGRMSKFQRIFIILLIAAALYVMFSDRFTQAHRNEVETELGLARMICENSYDWVSRNRDRLKMGEEDIKNLTVNGKHITLKHVAYPTVLFTDTGIREIDGRANTGFYCTFVNPLSRTQRFFYDYEKREWVRRAGFRR